MGFAHGEPLAEGDYTVSVVATDLAGNARTVPAVVGNDHLTVDNTLPTVAFTGAGGGKLGALADHLLAIGSRETARIQEAHILVGHMLCDWIELDWVAGQAGEAL